MSDEQENVGAGSETSGETTETAQTETAATETAQTESVDAGSAADIGTDSDATPKTGDPCTCPDGRAGTVHVLDEGLVCLPNQG